MKDVMEKYKKKLNPEFVEAVDQSDTDEIKKRIITSEGNLCEVEKAKDADEKLTAARNNVKEWGATYRESKQIETAKIKYCIAVLQSRGIDL
jgi:hypothetical protein